MLVNEFYVLPDHFTTGLKTHVLLQLSNAFVSEKSKRKYLKQIKHKPA